MTKHTPGPWVAHKGHSGLHEYASWMVPGVADCGYGERSEANARLIAAAPMMLAALEDAVNLADLRLEREHGGKRSEECQIVYDRCAAAIAKARGE